MIRMNQIEKNRINQEIQTIDKHLKVGILEIEGY